MESFVRRIHANLTLALFSQASKDTLFLMVLQVVIQINSIIAVFFVSRHLGPENVGFMSFAQTFIGFVFFLNAGLYAYYAYELAGKPHDRKNIVQTFFETQTVVNGLSLLIGSVAILSFPLTGQQYAVVIGSLVITYVSSIASFLNNFLLVEKKVKEYVSGGLLTSFSILIARIGGVYFDLPVVYFIALLILESLLFFFFLYNLSFIKREDLPRLSLGTFRTAFAEIGKAKYFIGLTGATVLFSRIDYLYIQKLLSSGDLGIYSAAVRLSEYPSTLMAILGSVLMPRLSEHTPNFLRKKILFFGFILYFVLSVAFCFILIIFGDLLVSLLYGPRFLPATSVLAIYAMVIPGLWLINFSTLVFGAFKKIKYGFFISIFGGTLSLILLTILIPSLGLSGAAISAVLSYSLTSIIAVVISIKVASHIFKN